MDSLANKIAWRIFVSVLMLIVTYAFFIGSYPHFLRGMSHLTTIYYSLIWGVGSISDAFQGVSSCVCGDTGGYLLGMEIVGYFTATTVVLQVIFNRISFLVLWAGGITLYMHQALSATFDFRSDSFVA